MTTQSRDTRPEAERFQIELIRRASPAQRLARVCSLSQTVMTLSHRAIQRANPELNSIEVWLRFAALHYGEALAKNLARYLEDHPECRRLLPTLLPTNQSEA